MADDNSVLNPNGLTDEQCKEVHDYFVKGLGIWVVVSLVAHVMTWQWMPWFPN